MSFLMFPVRRLNEWHVIPALAVSLALLCRFVTPYMWIASLAYAFMVSGMLFRKSSRRIHVYLMSSAMALDLALVGTLEIKRNAVEKALEFSLGPWQQAHIMASLLALSLYGPVFALGLWRYLRPGSPAPARLWHIRLGIAAFVLRSLGFLLMFSMLGMHNG